MVRRNNGLDTLRAALAGGRGGSPIESLGFEVFEDEDTTPPDGARAVSESAVTGIFDPVERRLVECAHRAGARLRVVRPALARLRSLLPGKRTLVPARDRDLLVLATADVHRVMTQARRSVRALMAELAELESESREVLVLAAAGEEG